MPRTGRCACGSTTFGIIDQNGVPYNNGNGTGIWTVPNFGPHPELQLILDDCDPNTPVSPLSGPFELVPDTQVENRFTLRWCAEQSGRNLVAADGETVLFTAPPETAFSLNGATEVTGPRTVGGLTITPNGVRGHAPSAVLALSDENPPPFEVDGEGKIVGTNPLAGSCFRFWPDEVPLADLEADPAAFQIDERPTFVCVSGHISGQQSTFIVQNDVQGRPQEHHVI